MRAIIDDENSEDGVKLRVSTGFAGYIMKYVLFILCFFCLHAYALYVIVIYEQ